jgi:Bacterial extracellular solute-binding protein, family 7
VIAAGDSEIAFDTISALGATPEIWPPGSSFTDFSGIVFTVGAMSGRNVVGDAVSATGNLNVFAVPFVAIVNPDVFASLDADQQAALRDAGPASVDEVLELTIAGQTEALDALCAAGLEFVTATDDELASIRAALDPVYTNVDADPAVAAYIDDVERLKAELGAPPDTVDCNAATDDT